MTGGRIVPLVRIQANTDCVSIHADRWVARTTLIARTELQRNSVLILPQAYGLKDQVHGI